MMSISGRARRRVDDLVAEAIDDLALLVYHVVILQRAFALLEVVTFTRFCAC